MRGRVKDYQRNDSLIPFIFISHFITTYLGTQVNREAQSRNIILQPVWLGIITWREFRLYGSFLWSSGSKTDIIFNMYSHHVYFHIPLTLQSKSTQQLDNFNSRCSNHSLFLFKGFLLVTSKLLTEINWQLNYLKYLLRAWHECQK